MAGIVLGGCLKKVGFELFLEQEAGMHRWAQAMIQLYSMKERKQRCENGFELFAAP